MSHRLATLSRRTKIAAMLAVDGFSLPLCFFCALALRLGSLHVLSTRSVLLAFAMALAAIGFFYSRGLYVAVIRFIELRAVLTIGIGLGFVVAAAYVALWWFGQNGLPRTALAVFWLVAFAYLILSRYAAQLLFVRLTRGPRRSLQRTIVYGTGRAGVQLAQAMQQGGEYYPVCFVDADSTHWRRRLLGLPVLAPALLDEAVDRYNVGLVVVALPSMRPSARREVLASLERLSVPLRVVPPFTDFIASRDVAGMLRKVDVADLLGRDPVPPDHALFSRCVRGRNVLVTGAGGTIGSELCRQILTQAPARLVLLDHSEFNLYAIEQELRGLSRATELVAVLGSVVDASWMTRVLRTHQIETLYHAAAYKHVPMVELNVARAVLNNVQGTLSVASAAAVCEVSACVLISTDKAVRPTNVMGCTKRIAELIFQAFAQTSPGTCFSMVRFGNVLGSSGSVVPLFEQQIERGGPVTLTHPDITRYFMLIPEAAQLVIQAGAMAQTGDLFVLDMGEPVRIVDLARKMIHLSGYTELDPQTGVGEIEIRLTGLRPGEKLYEELLIGDDAKASEHPRILRVRERCGTAAPLLQEIRALCLAAATERVASIRQRLQALVPEATEVADPPADDAVAGPVADRRLRPIGSVAQPLADAGVLTLRTVGHDRG